MRCPHCQSDTGTKVIDTTHESRGGIRRRRECKQCGKRFSSHERAVLATPLVIKEDGGREEFDHQKLLKGLRVACVKRPVSAADLERLAGEIETSAQRMGQPEISSRVIGDLAIAGLKDLDQVAYIRYAIVYLGLDDLHAIRKEVDRLIESA